MPRSETTERGSRKTKRRSRWTRLAGQGFELTASVLGFAAFGYWIGRYFDKAELGLLAGSLLGIFGGLYNLIRVSLREINKQNRSTQEKGEP